MDRQHQKEIISAMNKKLTEIICLCCGDKERNLLPGYTMQQLQDKKEGFIIGGNTLPTVGRCCANCGYIENFALKILVPKLFDEK